MSNVVGERLQEFSEYVGDLFQQTQPDTVVEIGPDIQLRLMPKLGQLCGRYVGVTLPEYYPKSQHWLEMHKDMGIDNVELIEGNAVELPRLVPKADFVIVHNVLLEYQEGDTALMWQYRRGERQPSEEEQKKLAGRFASARGISYKGFLEVANPGQILTFHRAEGTAAFTRGITEVIGVDERKVTVTPLAYDGGDTSDWELVAIDNS